MVDFDRANLILVLLFLCFFADLRICEKVETSDKENADVSWYIIILPYENYRNYAWTGPLSWQVVSLILSGFHSNARGWNWWPPLRSSLGKCMVWAKAIYIYNIYPSPQKHGWFMTELLYPCFIHTYVCIHNIIYIYIYEWKKCKLLPSMGKYTNSHPAKDLYNSNYFRSPIDEWQCQSCAVAISWLLNGSSGSGASISSFCCHWPPKIKIL